MNAVVIELVLAKPGESRPVYEWQRQVWDDSDEVCERLLAWLRGETS